MGYFMQIKNSVFVLVALLFVSTNGCVDQHRWVYIDNSLEAEMKVEIDGRVKSLVAPGEFERIRVRGGERKFKVTCGDEIIFHGIKTVRSPENLFEGAQPHYLFNPDESNHYWVYKITYNNDSNVDQLGDGPFHDNHGRRRNHLSRDAKPQEQWTDATSAFENLRIEYHVIKEKGWFQIPVYAHVLSDGPAEITAPEGVHRVESYVLARATKDNFCVLRDAWEIRRPTDDDLMKLTQAYKGSQINE